MRQRSDISSILDESMRPYESVWPEVEGILKRSPTVEATTVFDHLNRVHEGKFEEGQLRTLQRHIKQ